MGIAVFTDIHGNLEALEAILCDIKKNRKVQDIYFLGDAVTFGPDSSACLKLLKKNNVKCVIGNHEQRMIRYDKKTAKYPTAGIKHLEYIYHSLDNEDLHFIKNSMPLERYVDYKGCKLYFAHYCHDEDGIVCEDMDYFREDLLDKLFAKKDCDVVFIGHLHQRKLYIRSVGKSYFCLDGSGCFLKNGLTHYTYFDVSGVYNNNFDIYRVDVKYDHAKLYKKLCEQPIPDKVRCARDFLGIELPQEEEQQ